MRGMGEKKAKRALVPVPSGDGDYYNDRCECLLSINLTTNFLFILRCREGRKP